MLTKTKTILLVDDETDILDPFAELLDAEGFRVVTAKTGDEFRDKAFTENPDLVVLDIILGNEKGPDVYDELLEQGFSPEIPVVFLTAFAGDADETPLRPGHRFALYNKPVKTSLLIQSISTCLRAA